MSFLIDKAAFTAHMYREILAELNRDGEQGDGLCLIQMLAGVVAETILVFDDPDEGLTAALEDLAFHMGCVVADTDPQTGDLPPAYIIDAETESGRAMARRLFEEWMDCPYEFYDLLIFVAHHILSHLADEKRSNEDIFGLFEFCLTRSLANEIAAQELCDIVIEEKIGVEGWGLSESVSGLSAVAGRLLGLSRNACEIFQAPQLPNNLDQVAYVMTQEAVRLGIPAGSDWRFGLAANDGPVSAPFDLIFSLLPRCRELLEAIGISDDVGQAVAVAKAAGRMLAVAAGGDRPELEPLVAKPLAMAAMTDSYKALCLELASNS